MKILITGGAGFIGSNFIRYWFKKYPNDGIVNLDKLTYAGNLSSLRDVQNNPKYSFIKGDICNGKLVNELMKGIDLVVAFAAESHVDRSILGPQIFVKTNVLGTQVLLDAAVKAKIKRFHHVSCYDEDTKAFTREGLKKYDEIKEGDCVLSINPINNRLEWKPVEKVIIQDYEGKLIKIKTKTVNLLVTPNHRIFIQQKRSKKLIFKEAEFLKKVAISKIPKYYQWEGIIPEKIKKFAPLKDFLYLLGIFIGDGFLAYQEKITPSKSGLTKNVLSRSWRIFLDIPQKDNCFLKCQEVLNNLKIKWHLQKGKAGEHFYFTSQDLSQVFKECGPTAKEKRIPEWALDLPKNLLEQLFLGLLDSDGSKRRIFFTSSQVLLIQFLELCVKLNLSPVWKVRHSVSKIGERKIEGDSYVISIRNRWRDIRKQSVKEIFYKGKVWCLKVKDNKNFLIEREGRTLFCGNTDEVFGALPDEGKEKFNESWPFRPNSPYAASKAGADCLVRAYFKTYGLPVSVTNCSNNYGPYQFPEKLIPLAITNLMEDKKVPVYGDGMQVRDWLYVEDHCRAIEMVLQNEKTIGETFCVGGLIKDIPNIEVVKKILKIMGKNESTIEYVKDRLGHDRRYSVDWSKIKNTLSWEPRYDFDTWLEKTISWYQNNTNWWKPLKEKQKKYFNKQYYKKVV